MQVDQVARFTLHKGSVYALSQGSDASSFLSAGSEGLVVEWNINDASNAVALARVNSQVFALLNIPEKKLLVIGTMAGGIHVIDLVLKSEIHYITYHQQSIFDIKLYNDQVLVASKDGTLTVWSAVDFSLQRILTISNLSLRMIDLNPLKNEMAIASSDNKVYIVDLSQWKVKAILQGPSNSVFSVSFIPALNKLLAGSRDAQLYEYDLNNLQLEKQIKAHLYTINHLQLISGDQFIATASRDKTIRIWNSHSLELLKSLDHLKCGGHTKSVNRLLWLPEQNVLVSASDDRTVIAWRIH